MAAVSPELTAARGLNATAINAIPDVATAQRHLDALIGARNGGTGVAENANKITALQAKIRELTPAAGPNLAPLYKALKAAKVGIKQAETFIATAPGYNATAYGDATITLPANMAGGRRRRARSTKRKAHRKASRSAHRKSTKRNRKNRNRKASRKNRNRK